MQELLISGNTISLVEKRVVHTTTIDEFEKAILNMSPLKSEILPAGCKAFIRNHSEGLSCYVVERLPGLTSLTFHTHRHRTDDLQDYLLSLPFMQFYVLLRDCPAGYAFCSVYLSCTKVPIRSYKDHIYVMPLPNIFADGEGKVCTGDIQVSMATPADACEELISSFFSAPSNLDLSLHYPDALRANGSSHENALNTWRKLSEGNPLFGISKDITYRDFAHHESCFEARINHVMNSMRR